MRTNQSEASPTQTADAAPLLTSLTDSSASPSSPGLSTEGRRVSFKERQRLAARAVAGGGNKAATDTTATDARRSQHLSLLSTSDSLAANASVGTSERTASGSPVSALAARTTLSPTQTGEVLVSATTSLGAVSSPNPPRSLETSGRKLSFKDRQRLAKTASSESSASASGGVSGHLSAAAPRPSLTTTSYRQTQRNSAVAGTAPLVGPPLSLRLKTDQGVMSFGSRSDVITPPPTSTTAVTATGATTASPSLSPAATAPCADQQLEVTRRGTPSPPPLQTMVSTGSGTYARQPDRLREGDEVALLGAVRLASDDDDDQASIEQEYVSSRHASPPANRSNAMTISQASPHTAQPTPCPSHPEHSPLRGAPPAPASAAQDILSSSTGAALPAHQGVMHSLTASTVPTECRISPQSSFDRVDSSRSPQRREGDDERPHSDHPTSSTTHTRAAGDREDNCDFDAADEEEEALALAATQNGPLEVGGFGEPNPQPVHAYVARPMPTVSAPTILTTSIASPPNDKKGVDFAMRDAETSPEKPATRRCTVQPSLLPAHQSSLSWDAASKPMTVSARGTGVAGSVDPHTEKEDEGRSEGETHTPSSTTPRTLKNVLSHWAEQEGFTTQLTGGDSGAHGPHVHSLSNSSVASSGSNTAAVAPLSRSPASHSSRTHTFMRVVPSDNAISALTPVGTPTVGSRRERGKMLSSRTPRLPSQGDMFAFPRSPVQSHASQRNESPGSLLIGGGSEGFALPVTGTDAYHAFAQRIQQLAQDSLDESHFSARTCPTLVNSGEHRGWSPRHAASHTYDSVMMDELDSVVPSRTVSRPASISPRIARTPQTAVGDATAASAVSERLAHDTAANTNNYNEHNNNSFPAAAASIAASSVPSQRRTTRTAVPPQSKGSVGTGLGAYKEDSLANTQSSAPTPLSPEVLHTADVVGALSPYVPSRLLTLPMRTGGGGGTRAWTAAGGADPDDEEADASETAGSCTLRSHTDLIGDVNRSHTELLGETGHSQTDLLGTTTGRLANSVSLLSVGVASRTNRRTSTFSSLQFSMNRRRPHRQSSQHRQLQQKQAHHNRSASSQLFSSSGELYVSGNTSKNQSRNTRGGSQSGAATSRRPSRTDINPLGRVQTLDGVAGGGSSSDTSCGGPLGNSESQLLSTTLGDASVVVHDDFSSTYRAGLGAGAEPGVVTHTIAVPSLPGPNVAVTTSLQGTEVTASAATGSGLLTKDDTDTVREVKGDSEPEEDGNPLARAEETLRAMAVDEVLPGEETVGLWSTAEVVFLPQYELLTPSETAQEMTLRALRSVTASPVSGVGGGGTPRGALIPPATPSPLPPAKVSPPLASHTTPPAALPSSVALPTSAVHVDAAGSVPGPAGASRTASPGVHRGLSLDAEGVFLFGRIASDYYVEPCDKQVREWNVSRTACPSPMEPHSLSPNLRPLTSESSKGGGDASLKAAGDGSIRSALREPEDDCKIGARLLMNADSGVMLLAPHDEVEKYASKRTAAELEAEIDDEEGGACACDEAFIGKDSRGMDYSRYNAHALFDHCVFCARRPASFLCVHCFVAVCPSHVSRHHRHSPNTCTLFLNLLDIMTSFDRIFWCEKCQQFTWKYTEIYDPLVDQLASTRGTYLTTASRDMRCVGYEVRFTDEPEDERVPQTFDDQDDRACSVNNHGDSHTPRVALNEEADGAEAAPHKEAVTQTAQPTTSTRPREDEATHRNEKESADRALQNPLSAALPDSDSVSLAGSHTPSSASSSSSTAITVPSLVAPMQEHLVRPKPSELPGDDCVVPLGKAVRRLQGLGCSVQGWRATQEDAEAAFMIDIPALHTKDEDNSAEAVAARHARRRLRRATAETWVASGEQSPSGSPSRRRRAGRAVKSTSSSLNASPRVNAANEEGASIAREGGKDIDEDDDVDEEETIPMAVFCVFDGHGGDAVAKIAASRFETHLRAAVQNTRPDDIRARALLFYLNTESSHTQFGSPGRRRHSSATRGNRAGGGGGVDGTASSLTGSLPTNTQEAGSLENESRHRPHHSHHPHHHRRHSSAEVAGTTRLLVPSSEGVGAMSHSGHSPALSPGSPLSTVGAGPRRTTAHQKSLLPAAVASSMGGTIPVISTLPAAPSLALALPLTTGTEKASSVRLSTGSPHAWGHSVGNPAVVVKMTEENLRRQQNHLKPVSLYGQLVDEGGPDAIILDTLVQPEQFQQGSPPFLARGAAGSKGSSPSLGQAARASAPAALTLPAPAGAACLSPASASAHLGFAGGENDMAMPFSPTSTLGPAPTEPLEPAPAASAMTVSEMEMLRSYFASIMEEALLSLDDAIRKTPEGYRGDYNCVGCTACIVGITSNFILCANVGDSGAAFYTPQTITPISVTHRLQGETEVNRIRAAGYNIVNDRIEGMLAVPRALGDFDFKQCGGKGPREQAVSCVPDVTIRPVPSDTERWGVIAACDGVWDTATLHQVHFALTNTPNDLEVATSAADAVLRAKELVRHHRRGPASFLHDITSPPSSRRVEVARKKSLTGEMPLGTSTLSSEIPVVSGKPPLPPADLHAPVDGGEGGVESDTEAHLGGSMVTDFGGEVWYGGIDAQLLTAAAGVLAQCVAPADNMAGIGLDNCSLIIVEYRE